MAAAASTSTQPTTRILPPGQTQSDLKAYLLSHVPKFVAPTDAKQWTAQAERLRQRVLDEVVFHGIPKSWLKGSPKVVWGETIAAEGYVIRKLSYEAVPGLWVGALLYKPVNLKGKVPAVLNVNGHVGEPGMTVDYEQARCINLAKRGILALSLEWIGMGQLGGPGYAHNDLAYLDLCGRAGLSVFYLELKRGLDILCSHKATDRKRVAVTGLSGGGWQTILISALDTRVKLSAPNAGYCGLEPRIEYPGDTGDLEQNANDLVSVADYVHLTALLAPRPALLIYNAKDDCCFLAERALVSVYKPIVPVYQMFGQPDRFAYHVNEDPGTHNYLKDNRQAFYRFLNRHFVAEGQRIDDEIPVDSEIRSSAALAIAYPPNNATFQTLAADVMKSLPRRKRPTGGAARIERWRKETRAKIGEIVRLEPNFAMDLNSIRFSKTSETVQGVVGLAARFRISGQWTVPVISFSPPVMPERGITVIVADGGLAEARPIVAEVMSREERAIVVDLLFTGECLPTDRQAWSFAQMIATVGRRPLGIQISQLRAVMNWAAREQADAPLHMIAKGRVAGLAALVYATLEPDRLGRLEMREMDITLKDLLTKKITYSQAPSIFCFGLLEIADVPELIELAKPTRVEMEHE
jgi:dienelactone hydrolase